MTDEEKVERGGFGPIFSRMYSFMAARSGRSLELYRYIAEEVSRHNPEKVLDVGCGPGILIKMIAERSPQSTVYGVDPSSGMISVAQKRLSRYIREGRAFISGGDSLNVPFDVKFDLIVSSMSFHHWQHRNEGLDYLSRKLNDGGSLVIFERLYEKVRKEKRTHHSLSREEADQLSLEGFQKKVNVEGDIISVSFTSG